MAMDENKSPYKFLDSFAQQDGAIFFGRDQEVEELYAKVFQSPLVLVYGASGTGKSSIINCGLANRFRNTDWLPISIRRGGNILQSMHRQISREVLNPDQAPTENELKPESFRELLSSVFLDHFKPIYLIFDQFEELFIFGSEEEWRAFIETVSHLLNTDLDVHFIFVIRGEYLEFLSEFEETIPDFFDNRVRIEKMTRKNAEKIISEPARLFSVQLDEGFEENLLKKISPDKAHVELTFVQVFLDRLYKKALEERKDDGPVRLKNADLENIGQLGDVLAEFVDDQLFKMPNTKEALTVLKSFVSLQGTKTQMSPVDVQRHLEALGQSVPSNEIDLILSELVNRRILKEKDENGHYELRHDSLAQKIYEKITLQERELLDVQQFLKYSLNEFDKRSSLLKDEDLAYIAPYEETLKLDEATQELIRVSKKNSSKRRKSRRTRTIIALIIIALSISSVLGFFYSQSQREKAERMAQQANEKSREAQQQKELANRKEEEARQQAGIAQQETEKANAAKAEALRQQREAEQQKTIADEQRQSAEQSKQVADQSAQEALKSKAVAEDERQKAYALRVLGLVRELSIKSTYTVEPETKSLLALQAYFFNKAFGGKTFNAELHRALLLATQASDPNHSNTLVSHGSAIRGMIAVGDQIISCSHDGKIVAVKNSGSGYTMETLVRTNEVFESLAVSPDGKTVVLGTQSGGIVVLNPSKRTASPAKSIFNTPVIRLLEAGNSIYAIGANGTIAVLDWAGNVTATHGVQRSVQDATRHPRTGEIWLLASKNEILVFKDNVVSRQFVMDPANTIKAISFGVNGTLCAVGFDTGTVGLWNVAASRFNQLLPGHTAAITDLKFSADGKLLASASYDRSVRVWKLDQLQEQPVVLPNHDNWVSAVTFSEGGEVVAGTYNGSESFYPISLTTLADQLCKKMKRNLTETEWTEYVGRDVQRVETCKP